MRTLKRIALNALMMLMLVLGLFSIIGGAMVDSLSWMLWGLACIGLSALSGAEAEEVNNEH